MLSTKFKAVTALLLAAVCLTFSGCSSEIEIEKRVIVHGIGVDKAGDEYEVSLQIFSPSGAGSDTPIDPSQPNMKVVSGKGKTIYEGVSQCERLLGSKAFIGHNRLIIFGSSLYDEDMSRLLEWFRKENESYLGVTVAYAEGSAKEVLSVQLTEGSSTIENVTDIIEFSVDSGITVKSDLLKLMNKLSEPMGNGLLPVIGVYEPEGTQGDPEGSGGSREGGSGGSEGQAQDGEQLLHIVGTAVLKDRKLAGILDSDQSAGVLWLNGLMKSCTVTLEGEQDKFNVRLSNKKTKVKLGQSDGRAVLSVDIQAVAELLENVSEENRKNTEALAEEKILSDCRSAAHAVIDDLKADALRAEQLAKFYTPALYLAYEDDFEQILSAMEVNVSVKCTLSG